jgi:hypothetical protein
MTMITNSSSVPLQRLPGLRQQEHLVHPIQEDDGTGIHNERVARLDFMQEPERPVFWPVVAAEDGVPRPPQRGRGFMPAHIGGSSRVDLQACKLGTGRRFTTS